MKFTLHEDRVIGTTKGHAIEFKKGVPTHVPKECWNDVRGHGAVAEDQSAVDEQKPAKGSVDDPETRKKALYAAYAELVETNKRGDFDPTGAPSLKVVNKTVGFDVDIKERDATWADYKAAGKV